MVIEKDILELIDKRRLLHIILHWFRHVMKMEDGRLPREMMGWTPKARNRKRRHYNVEAWSKKS